MPGHTDTVLRIAEPPPPPSPSRKDVEKNGQGNLEGLGEVNLTFIEEEDEGDGGSLGKWNNRSFPSQNLSAAAVVLPNRERRRSSSAEKTFRQATNRTIRRVSRVFTSVGLLPSVDIKLIGISEQELLLGLFEAFDYYRTGKLNQEKWIDLLKMRLNQFYADSPLTSQFEERKVDFVEIIESVSYAVCGDADLNFESFCLVFKSKNVLNKFYRLIDRDLDGVVTVEQVMEFISQLSSARCGSRLTRDNIAYLERLFRQYVGDEKEIKKSDFSKIIQTKNQFFTDRVFDIFDDDANGSISLQEFLDAMHKFTGENPEDKIRFLFKVYDVDGDGLIQEAELEQVMLACMEENGMKFSDEQIHDLTMALFDDADVERRGALTYDALKAQLEKHGGLLENLSISIERWLVPVKPVVIQRKASLMTKLRSCIPHQCSSKYLKNNYVFVVWIAGFLLTNLILFLTRAVCFSDRNQCATIWLVLAKSSGQALNFNCTYILVLMLKQCLTFLRARGASMYLPIDQHLYFHKLAGYFIVGLGLVHSFAHLMNIHFGFVQNQKINIDCSDMDETDQRNRTFVEYLFVPDATRLYGLIPGFAFNSGILIFIILAIMFVCSLPFVRRSGYFQVFYWTHTLYVFFWILLIIHASNFWKWFLVPGIIFIIEQAVRIYRWRLGRGKTFISSGILLPSKVTHLIIRRPPQFHFHPGDYVFVRIPAIAKFEWHPFTISSSPEQEDAIWLHVRAAGEWTSRLYEYFEHEQSNLSPGGVWDYRSKNDGAQYFTNSARARYRKRETASKYLGNPLTANPRTRPQLKSVADSVTSFVPNSNHSSYGNMTPDDTLTSCEDVLNVEEEGNNGTKKLVLCKMNSMPDMSLKVDRMLNMKPLSRSESVKDSPVMIPPPRRRFDSSNRSHRYLRFKPTIITFKTPQDEDDAEKGMQVNLIQETRSIKGGGHPDSVPGESHQFEPTNPVACYELGTTRISREQLSHDGKPLEIFIDGPLGASSSQIFRAEHAVLIATGIGVTPFASILQSIMRRYWASRNSCPNCNYTWCSELPESVLHLRKVDFFWINRDQRSFEWFVHLLSQLEIEQAELGGAMERFLDMHMYITSALQKTDMKAVGLQLALDLLHEKEKRDLITGLKTRTNAGRPNWNKIFRQLQDQKKGKVTVFYCGPPALARTLKLKCDEFGFSFRKEIF